MLRKRKASPDIAKAGRNCCAGEIQVWTRSAQLANGMTLIGVNHPSQQNTQTGKLTPEMYTKVLNRIRKILRDDC
jgi:uracil-DNA glycosylase